MTNANTTFGQLPIVIGGLDGTEIIPLDQAGTTKSITTRQLSAATVHSSVLGNPLIINNDTNVTATIGGISSIALLSSATITLGWNGTLSSARQAANTAYKDQANIWTSTGFQGGFLVSTPNPFTSNNEVINSAFVQSAIRGTMATVPLSGITGGTYSFASNGTQGVANGITVVAGAVTNITGGFASGTGWKVGDLFTLTGSVSGNGDAVLRVLSLAGSTPATFEILYGGTGYNSAPNANFSAPTTLSSFTIDLTGVLTSNATFIMPSGTRLAQSDQWLVNNNTTGAFTVTFKISDGTDTATGTGVIVPQGANNSASTLLQTDGVNDIWFGIGYLSAQSIAVSSAATIGASLTANSLLVSSAATISASLAVNSVAVSSALTVTLGASISGGLSVATGGAIIDTGSLQFSSAGAGSLLRNSVGGFYKAVNSGATGHYTIFNAPSTTAGSSTGAQFFQARDADNSAGDANWGYLNNDTLKITNRANSTTFATVSQALYQFNTAFNPGLGATIGNAVVGGTGGGAYSMVNGSLELARFQATTDFFLLYNSTNSMHFATTGGVYCFTAAPSGGVFFGNNSIPTDPGVNNATFNGTVIVSCGATFDNTGATYFSTNTIPAGGSSNKGIRFVGTTSPGIFFGSGAPTLIAGQGSLYLRSDGTSSVTRAYVNSSGSSVWQPIFTSA